jgi:hypothetical protein
MNSLPTISVKLTQLHYTCVLDPTLALSRYGLMLVKQLGVVMDLWLGREFWHIIDNTQFYLQYPEALLLSNATDSATWEQQLIWRQDIIHALTIWEGIQDGSSLAKFKLFRVGDRPLESFLPQGIEPEIIIGHYELLADSLAKYIEQYGVREGDRETDIVIGDTLNYAFQDTVALAASLDSCFILSFQSAPEISKNLSPKICMAMESWGIPCQPISQQDEFVAIERHELRQLIVRAGLAKFLWSGLQIVVLHLLVPTTSQLQFLPIESQKNLFSDVENYPILSKFNPWEVARCFWYQL